jgi:hypothetical protein
MAIYTTEKEALLLMKKLALSRYYGAITITITIIIIIIRTLLFIHASRDRAMTSRVLVLESLIVNRHSGLGYTRRLCMFEGSLSEVDRNPASASVGSASSSSSRLLHHCYRCWNLSSCSWHSECSKVSPGKATLRCFRILCKS